MNLYLGKGLSFARRTYTTLSFDKGAYDTGNGSFDFIGQRASDIIKQKISNSDRLMVCRFGWVELNCLVADRLRNRSFFKNSIDFIRGDISSFWREKVYETMSNNAGFFPTNEENIKRFCDLMLKEMSLVDILGSWRKEESIFSKELSGSIKIPISDLDPFKHADPWSEALKDKIVFVIHPFEESINKQFKNREFLFNDKRILPEFELKTLKAVQSIANNKTEFSDWFEALDYMKEKISATHFDVAIIGCGAYGFPLAAHVKRMGKKAIHLGGATQILFGIKGKRWESIEHVSKHINQYWTFPMAHEYPANYKKVENGCYW